MIRYFSEIGQNRGGAADPLAVLNFNVVLVNPDGVDLQTAHCTWTANASYETEIWRNLDSGGFALLTTVAPNVGEYDDELMDGDEHEVEYYARHKWDQTVLNAPTGFAVAIITEGYRITGNVNNTEADNIEIQASINGAAYAVIATVAVSGATFSYDYTYGTANIDFKARAKEGTLPVYSAFTAVVSILISDVVIGRITAADGVAPSVERKAAIATAINSLIANNLLDTQFDSLVVYRGKGQPSTKLNWIKNAHNANEISTPTYIEDVGYKTNGAATGIDSNYTPATANGLMKLNDACWGFKVSGTVGSTYFGELGAAYTTLWSSNAQNASINAAYAALENFTAGYNCLSRDNATQLRVMRGAGINSYNQNSSQLAGTSIHLLRLNYTVGYVAPNTCVLELEWKGKALSQSQFLIFQSIFDTYFASL